MNDNCDCAASSNDCHLCAAVGKCKAKYTHQGNMAPPGDSRPLLQFQLNDVIEVLDNSTNPNWWEVRACYVAALVSALWKHLSVLNLLYMYCWSNIGSYANIHVHVCT